MAKDAIATTSRERVQAFHQQMLARAQITDRGEDVMAQQAEKIFAASESDDLDKILSADMGGTIQGRDVPGTVWEIRSFDPVISNRTDLETTNGYYMSCDATYLGGPRDIATQQGLVLGQAYALQTGAELIMFKLAAIEASELFPVKVSIVGTKTQSGRQVLRLGPPPESVVTGETA